jgi:hypothetical protein
MVDDTARRDALPLSGVVPVLFSNTESPQPKAPGSVDRDAATRSPFGPDALGESGE